MDDLTIVGRADDAPVAIRRNLCDIQPSRFDRIPADVHLKLDADWIVPARLPIGTDPRADVQAVRRPRPLVLELRKLGFEVDAAELSNYPEPLVPDIFTGADVFDVDSFARYLGDYEFALGRTQSGALAADPR
jgi:hypothetical protein